MDFVIHWNETAMGLHVFPIPIPPPTFWYTLKVRWGRFCGGSVVKNPPADAGDTVSISDLERSHSN